MMDGDISLRDFDMARFLTTLNCAFPRRPLVAQALVAEGSQTYKYLNAEKWRRSHAVATYSGFVEIQAPLMDAPFLEWFVLAFVVPMLLPSHILGADWGFDELFCKAAEYYQHLLLLESAGQHTPEETARSMGRLLRVGAPSSSSSSSSFPPACGIVVGGTPIHHVNAKEMNSLLGYEVKRRLNKELMRLIRLSFPHFVRPGKDPDADPLSPQSHFQKMDALRPDCSVASDARNPWSRDGASFRPM
jgi:hypothetical protein